ncbi:DUF6318 family protein [Pseudarthrobacter sp. J47]
MNIRTALSSNPRGLVVAFLAAAALALTGCQGGGDPAADPTSASASTTASATPTPTPTPSASYKPADASGKAQNVPVPVKPALADENSKEGLEAFTKYWYELLSYGYETGDTSAWVAATQPGCRLCDTFKQGLADSYADNHWVVGGRLTTPSIQAHWQEGASKQSVAVQVIQDRIEFYGPPSVQPFSPLEETNVAAAFFATHVNGSWVAVDIGQLV